MVIFHSFLYVYQRVNQRIELNPVTIHIILSTIFHSPDSLGSTVHHLVATGDTTTNHQQRKIPWNHQVAEGLPGIHQRFFLCSRESRKRFLRFFPWKWFRKKCFFQNYIPTITAVKTWCDSETSWLIAQAWWKIWKPGELKKLGENLVKSPGFHQKKQRSVLHLQN